MPSRWSDRNLWASSRPRQGGEKFSVCRYDAPFESGADILLHTGFRKVPVVMEFITADEKLQIETKLEDRKAQRAVLSVRIAEARALGDLKENADYHAAREDQGLNEAEIRRLEEKLRQSSVIEEGAVPTDIVFLGSVVRLRDEDDDSEELYKIVGQASGTFNFDSDEIEVTATSPMGESLMKARVGDSVKVSLPRGEKRFVIVEIR